MPESPIGPGRAPPGRLALFLGFLKVGLLGFGGVAAWAYRIVVEQRRWLGEEEYAALLGVCQVLPGPNMVNAAVMIGDRFQGLGGALAAVLGLMAMPLAILMTLATLFARFQSVADVRAAIVGTAWAAAGIVIGIALRMARRVKPSWNAALFGSLVFAAVGLLQLSLIATVLVLAPLSVATVFARRRP